MLRPTILAVTLACFALPAFADRVTFRPKDEASRDPDLAAFRADLLQKIRNRDTEAVVAAACDSILISFGGNGTKKEFHDFLTVPEDQLADDYKAEAPAMRAANWAALERVLSSPGYFTDDDSFWMPYHWRLSLPDDMDPFTSYVVDGVGVRMRSAPGAGGRIVEGLSHEVLTIDTYDPDAKYQKVRLGDGQEGFVYSKYLTSLIDYRAELARGPDGNWELCVFVAGD